MAGIGSYEGEKRAIFHYRGNIPHERGKANNQEYWRTSNQKRSEDMTKQMITIRIEKSVAGIGICVV